MQSKACSHEYLSPGQCSSFIIYCLNEFFSHQNKNLLSYMEVGFLFVGSLCALYKSGFNGIAYAIDIFEGYYGKFDNVKHTPYPIGYPKTNEGHVQIVKENCALYIGKPNCIIGDSRDPAFADKVSSLGIQPLDVLYANGDNYFVSAMSDFKLFFSLLKNGGILLMDNFEESGVEHAVEVIETKYKKNIEKIGVWNASTWINIKT